MALQKVISNAQKIVVPQGVEGELIEAYKMARAIDEYLIKEYFATQSPPTEKEIKKKIGKILDYFVKKIITQLQFLDTEYADLRNVAAEKNKNIFIYAGAKRLFLANRYTRIISETLGHVLEDIANIDTSKVFDSETGFSKKIKIKGVDKFILSNGEIIHAQIKTKKDTLTGSQSPRSVNELKIHPNPMFAAALDLGKGWTFPPYHKTNIKRVTGEEFWDLVGLDYDLVLSKVSKAILKIEKLLYTI